MNPLLPEHPNIPQLSLSASLDSPVTSDGSHLLCLQSSSVLIPQWKSVPRDCLLLQDLHWLPLLSLRLTPAGFFTTPEVLVFLLLPDFLSSSIFLPWILSLSKEKAGAAAGPSGAFQMDRLSFGPGSASSCTHRLREGASKGCSGQEVRDCASIPSAGRNWRQNSGQKKLVQPGTCPTAV